MGCGQLDGAGDTQPFLHRRDEEAALGRAHRQVEADLLEEDPLFREIIQMRRWDEAAKIENRPIPSLDIFRELIFQHLQEQPD